MRRLVVLAGVLGVALTGCADSERRSTGPDREGQAAALVVRLDGLVRAGRYQDICDGLLTAGARGRAGGSRCARQLRVGTVGVRDPSLALQSVRQAGDEVRAQVVVASAGHRAGARTVVMIAVGRGLRIDGLTR